jgi:SAM-dependent methyltransferase
MERTVYARMGEIEERHWWFAGRREILSALIRRFNPAGPDAKFLEAGCGTGGNLVFLGQFGELDAFEYDEQSRALACEKSGLPVAFGSLPDELPFGEKKFDVIFLLDVLEHVERDRASLQALAGCLSSGGRIIVTVPAMPWLWSQHDEVHHHFRRYTKSGLTRVVEEAGLDVACAGYFNFLLFPVALLKRCCGKLTRSDTADDEIPSTWLNAALYHVFRQEAAWIGRIPMPFGLSCFAVLQRPND